MAIATAQNILDGNQIPVTIAKIGFSGSACTNISVLGCSPWFAAGSPAASTATAVGVNGEAVIPALGSVASRVGRNNPPSGSAYISKLKARRPNNGATVSGTGILLLVDRLWQNSGLSSTLTTAQAITPAALPARDRNASTNGEGILAAIEWSTAAGAGAPTITLTYTNSAGTGGKTATLTGTTAVAAGSWEFFPLAAGDTGVRGPTSFIQSVTRTSGSFSLVLFRVIAAIPFTDTYKSAIEDAVSLGMPLVFNDSVLQFVVISPAANAGGLSVQYQETQG